MSLLDNLKRKRKELKSCETCVTTPSGFTYTERLLSDGSTSSTTLKPSMSPGFVIDTKPDMEIAWVFSNLAMGSQDVAQNIELLKDNSFTHVLSIGIEIRGLSDSFHYEYVELLDLPETRLQDVLECCFQFLDEGRLNGRVFTHCNAGVSRSSSIILAYLIRNGRTYNEAYDYLKSKRSVIRPNDGFVKQLKEMEKEVRTLDNA